MTLTLNGKRLLSPKTIELMSAVHAADTLPGRPKGRGFGLSVQVVSDAISAGYRVSDGSYGWDGAFGTHFWVDPKEKIVSLLMVQTNNPGVIHLFICSIAGITISRLLRPTGLLGGFLSLTGALGRGHS